jgi:chromosome partitioning protein
MSTSNASFTVKKVLDIFGAEINRNTLLKAEAGGQIPTPERADGAIKRRMWTLADLPAIGERYGYLKKPQRPVVISTFTTKGGVLKTTLALNIARTAALHNIRTCVVGLDLQGDISAALGLNADINESDESMESAIEKLESPRGLFDFFSEECELRELLVDTDIPTLKFIPETPELVQLEQAVSLRDRREYWLKENVIEELQKDFDLIILDCSPNWNRLVTNALVACDVLVSPLECKINNFRNFKVFQAFLSQFREGMKLGFDTVFVPTRFSSNRKLSSEIRNWYLQHVTGCTHTAIRESTAGEEATAVRLSLPEYQPVSIQADEMRDVLQQVWTKVMEQAKEMAMPKANRVAAPMRPERSNEAQVQI